MTNHLKQALKSKLRPLVKGKKYGKESPNTSEKAFNNNFHKEAFRQILKENDALMQRLSKR
jgi:hypothetical protein